jgi:hypothetical protein
MLREKGAREICKVRTDVYQSHSIADSLMLQAMHMFVPLADSRLCLLPSLGRQNPGCECGNSPHECEVRIEALCSVVMRIILPSCGINFHC